MVVNTSRTFTLSAQRRPEAAQHMLVWQGAPDELQLQTAVSKLSRQHTWTRKERGFAGTETADGAGAMAGAC